MLDNRGAPAYPSSPHDHSHLPEAPFSSPTSLQNQVRAPMPSRPRPPLHWTRVPTRTSSSTTILSTQGTKSATLPHCQHRHQPLAIVIQTVRNIPRGNTCKGWAIVIMQKYWACLRGFPERDLTTVSERKKILDFSVRLCRRNDYFYKSLKSYPFQELLFSTQQ